MNFQLIKIAHITSVHPRIDTRIFLKECRSLAEFGYSVSLIVADGKGDESKDGVAIFDVGAPSGRLRRMLNTTRRVYGKAKSLNADIYHIHDPELIPVGLKLKRKGKKVIFDAHEDVPKQILSKPYLSKLAKVALSAVVGAYEKWACKKFDAIVTATPFIRDKFLSINDRVFDINNFPISDELSVDKVNWMQKKMRCVTSGGLPQFEVFVKLFKPWLLLRVM